MPKRKRDQGGDESKCILHVPSVTDPGSFTSLSKLKQGTAIEKLHQLLKIRDRRLNQVHDSPNRMQSVCNQIPTTLPDDLDSVGYHRTCYQRFTGNLDRLEDSEPEESTLQPRQQQGPRSTRRSSTGPLFPLECIFCQKVEIKVGSDRKTERPECFSSWKNKENAWEQIESRAEKMGLVQLYRLVKDVDLFAAEAKHHTSCLRSFRTAFANYERSVCRVEKPRDAKQMLELAAHEKAFASVLEYIRTRVVQQNGVVQLAALRLLYIDELKRNRYENLNYRSQKLLKRLQNHPITNKVLFTKVNQGRSDAITFWLVCSSNMTVSDALSSAYSLGSTDKCQDVALVLRGSILKAYKECQELPWPPTADNMELSAEKLLPADFIRFLSLLIAGKEENETSKKVKRAVSSIGQDICRAVSDGTWKLPKHVLLCMTVRHLFRSKQLTTILNRLGHSESYDFGLEIETALTKALDEVSTYLTPQIVKGEGNIVFHCEWDNLNKTTTNVHGTNIVNSAGGIMLQEVKPEVENSNIRTLPIFNKSHQRSLKIDTPATIPPLIFTRVGPKFPDGSTFTTQAEINAVYATKVKEYYLWLFARYVGSGGIQSVPGLGGFISATGTSPPRKSTLDYFTPIHQPITESSVVRELLKRSEKATAEVGQKWVINTFDLGVCMKVLPIIWRWPEEFANHVVIIGPFHTSMNYIGMITGHKMRGSGYTEILFEAQLVTSGSMKGVLSGKAYAKSLFCLKTVCEAMERLLMERFFEEENIPLADPVMLLNLIKSCNREHLDVALSDASVVKLIDKYQSYEEKVLKGHLGKTASFWMSFIRHCHLVFMLLYSVKTSNLELFHRCNGEMASLFFAFDGHNYSRYLVWLNIYLTNLERTHPGAKELLSKGAIAVARSMIPGALSAVDKTMEETFMRFAKSSGGFSGLYSQFGAYQKWCRSTSARAQFYERTLEMVDLITDPDNPRTGRHRELEKAEIAKSEQAVLRVIDAVNNFTNPFTIADKARLYSLASGAPVPLDVETDVLQAETVGKAAESNFIRGLQNREADSFFCPIKRRKLKTMETCSKRVTLTSSQGKAIQYQEQSNLAFLLLVKSQNRDEPLDLEELMKFPLLPVPPSLGTLDGFFTKTNKASILHYLLEDVTPEDLRYPQDAMFIQDGMALLHTLNNLPPTCGEICLQVLDQMIAKKNFIFSTDCYHPESIKAQERLRRGSSEKILLSGPATRKPYNFKMFLVNDDNKKQLCQLLLRVWSSQQAATRLQTTDMAVLIVEGRAYQLLPSNDEVEVREIPTIYSNQEETDTRVVLYLHYAVSLGYKNAVIRTPDTDIFVILLYHASSIKLTIYLDTGSGKHRQLINLSDLAESLGENYCSTLLGFYVFSGEDCTSSFKGKGKVGPLKKLEKNPRFHRTFQQLGEDWNVKPHVLKEVEQFTCLMYGQTRESSVDIVRVKLLRKMVGEDEKLTPKSKVDLGRLPPCHSALKSHVQRTNHRVALYKRAHESIIEKPKPYEEGQGWIKTADGILEPIWSCGPVLPSALVDLLDTDVDEEDDEGEEEEDEDYSFDSDSDE